MMKKNSLIHLLVLLMVPVLLCVFGAGCAKKVSPGSHVPPPSKKKPVYKKPGKVPATQRPYKIKGKKYTPIASADGFVQTGIASWYGKKFHGRKTANGETYDMYAMTAAHKTLPMNTWVLVHNLGNGKKIRVRVNDRGPFVTGRIIDLSYTGAKKIGMVGPGTAKVRVTALGAATSYAKTNKQTPVSFKKLDYWKGNFTVQVGAFQNRDNAENYRNKLSKTYLNAHIVTHNDYRGTFYRVRIGKFTNLKDAERFGENLTAREGFDQAFAVAE